MPPGNARGASLDTIRAIAEVGYRDRDGDGQFDDLVAGWPDRYDETAAPNAYPKGSDH